MSKGDEGGWGGGSWKIILITCERAELKHYSAGRFDLLGGLLCFIIIKASSRPRVVHLRGKIKP